MSDELHEALDTLADTSNRLEALYDRHASYSEMTRAEGAVLHAAWIVTKIREK